MIARTLRRTSVLIALFAAYVLVFALPFRFTARWLGTTPPETGAAPPEHLSLREAQAYARRVELAAARLPIRATCLVQAVALWLLLRVRGARAVIRLGVRKGAAGLEAHAWVSLAGSCLLGTQDGEAFTPIADLGGAGTTRIGEAVRRTGPPPVPTGRAPP